MNLDEFKARYSQQLSGLSAARVSTLWKKNKGANEANILEAIEASKLAQARDKQRRTTPGHTSATTVEAPPIPTTQPEPQLKVIPRPDYSLESVRAGLDPVELDAAVNTLVEAIQALGKSPEETQNSLKWLYRTISDAFLLNARYGAKVNVLNILRQ